MKRFESKRVLVTGGTSGIGQMIAVRFAQEGAHVAINYSRNMSNAEETEKLIQKARTTIQEQGVKDLLVKADVSDEFAVKRMVSEVVNAFGGLDILINNAGIQVESDSAELSTADFEKVINVNLKGAFFCAREAIAHFLSRGGGGVIVNISSVHEMIPKPKYLGYSVSKGGMHNLTRTLALEYARNQIRVNAIGPGATVTPINRSWIDDPKKKIEVEEHIPLGRAGTAEEMAAATAFLASDEAAYITGQTLFVDGGLTLYPDFRTAWSS